MMAKKLRFDRKRNQFAFDKLVLCAVSFMSQDVLVSTSKAEQLHCRVVIGRSGHYRGV